MANKSRRKNKDQEGQPSPQPLDTNPVKRESSAIIPKAPASLLQSFSPSEVPISFVWVLGLFLSFGALLSPWGQTEAGFNPDAHSSVYFQIGTLVLLLVYFIIMMGKGNKCVVAIPRAQILFPIFIFVAWMVISLIWAISFWEGIIKTLDWAASALALFLIVVSVRNTKAFKALIVSLFWGGFGIAILGVAQFLFSVDWVHQHAAPAATFGNKNMAAQYAVATLPFGICLFLMEKSKLLSAVYAAGSVLILALLQYAHARGSWLAGIIQILLFITTIAWIKSKFSPNFHFSIPKTIIAVAAVALLGVMSTLTPTSFVSDATMGIDSSINPKGQTVEKQSFADTIKHATNIQGTKEQRFTMWGNSWNMIKDTLPLGAGIGTWTLLYAKYQATYKPDYMLTSGFYHLNAHNDYIEFAAELGLVGAIAMLWTMVLLALMIWQILSSPKINNEIRVLAMAPVISVLGIFVTAFFSFPMQQATSIMLLLVGVACMISVTWGVSEKAQTQGPYQIKFANFPSRATTFVVLLAVLLFTIGNHRNWHIAEIAFRNAMASKYMGKARQTNQFTREAIKYNQFRKRPYYQLGNHYINQKDYRSALKHYEVVLEDYPYRIEMMQSVASAYLNVGRTEDARRILETWESIQPHSKKAKLLLAVLYYRIGKIAEAKELLRVSFTMGGSAEEDAYAKNLLTTIEARENRVPRIQIAPKPETSAKQATPKPN